ncbi:MAG: glycosyltransferase [Phaeodactylibacter sp.]|nr:glycosyltransferase [Phaeodactylibacter sp.]
MTPPPALYYARANRDNPYHAGIIRKCEAQAAAFRYLGIQMETVFLSREGVRLGGRLLARFPLSGRWAAYFFYLFRLEWILARSIDFSGVGLFYVRYPLASPALLHLLRSARRQNPSIRIVVEFPTFPYGEELLRKGIAFKLAYVMDRALRHRLKRHASLAVHYGEESEILGIPTVNLRNGIALDERPEFPRRRPGGEVRLVALGTWNFWHGLDRLLRGLADYYAKSPERRVTLTVIGEGPELPALKRLASALALGDAARFVSHLAHQDVKPYLLEADVGIGTLGLHRKQVGVDSSLKHREYCQHGLPFILSARDLDFPPGLPFVRYVPEGESPVDMEGVIRFWERLHREAPDCRQEARAYAESSLSWESRMQVVLGELGVV